MRVIVVAPPYTQIHAGVRVLYRLCHLLNEAGHDAYMSERGAPADWITPVSREMTPETVVVYPDVTTGNPLGARYVVRYLLNVPGQFGGPTHFDPTEMVWTYLARFLPAINRVVDTPIAHDRVLTIASIEPEHFYRDESIRRIRPAFCVGKGEAVRQAHPLPHEGKMVAILRRTVCTRAELGDLLRRTTHLYSYDPLTVMCMEAALCGTPSSIVAEDGTIQPWTFDPRDGTLDQYVFGNDHDQVARFVNAVQTQFALVEAEAA